MSGIWKRQKRSDIQTPTNRKGRKQLWLNLTPPRQISTLPCILGISRLNADTPAPPKTPAATPAATPVPANVHHSLTEPIESFGQFILHPTDPYQVIPGKDPKGWSFTLEPYLWALGISGDIGVRGFPASHVSISPVDVLKHFDWGVMMKIIISDSH
jgi:hypothetical protein